MEQDHTAEKDEPKAPVEDVLPHKDSESKEQDPAEPRFVDWPNKDQ